MKRKKSWKTITSQDLFKTKWLTFKHDRFYLPPGKVGNYYYIYTPGSVMIVPLISKNKLLLTKQYRYLMKKESIEFPAGGMKKGQTPIQAAQTELEEETGFKAKFWKKIGSFVPYNGAADEYCHVFLAKNLKRSQQRLEETETISLFTKSNKEFEKMIKWGKILDGMTLAAWILVQPYLK